MQLYNTLSRQVETVTPLAGTKTRQIGLYACGPTVYDYTHLGHLRKYTMDDVLIRVLRHRDIGNFQVRFVQNITDVGHLASDGDTGEDKLEKGAKKYNKTVWEVAHEFEDYYWRSMELMGNLKPDKSCRATDYIQEQLEMVKTLEQKGYTYVVEGDGVYFDTSKFEGYGELANLNLEEQKEGARVEVVEGKRNAADFAVWKFERPGENRAMSWPSPWAERSFPGWHIECSAMAIAEIAEQIEIHTGGIDHIPVHHTNEIAQAEAATDKKPFVKYWVHHNFLRIEGEKMSKSLGNVFTVDDILERGFDPMALRLLFLTTHYRSELNFTWDNLAGSQKSYEKLVKVWQSLAEVEPEVTSAAQSHIDIVNHALASDLNTAQAVAEIWTVLKNDQLSGAEKKAFLTHVDGVLQLGLVENKYQQKKVVKVPKKIQDLVDLRAEARAAKNWSESDRLRAEIEQAGYSVEDTGEGQNITKRA